MPETNAIRDNTASRALVGGNSVMANEKVTKQKLSLPFIGYKCTTALKIVLEQ